MMMAATDEEAPREVNNTTHNEEQRDRQDVVAVADADADADAATDSAAEADDDPPLMTVTDEEKQLTMVTDEELPFVTVNVESDEEAIVFMQEDTSVFEGYSTQAEDEEEGAENNRNDANEEDEEAPAVTADVEGGEVPTSNETSAENNNSGNNTQNAENRENGSVGNNENNEERDPELGLPLADLDSDNEEEETTDETNDNTLARRRSSNLQRRTLYWLRFVLHIVFFPVLVITSVAIPVLIVMFCFALMFVAMVVLLCVYYCCSPRRGDQAAVPFHVLIRQILEAVEDETHGLGDQNSDAPKHSREEIQNSLVRRKLIHFEVTDADGNVVPDPQHTDEATREERMHQDMFPVVSELSTAPLLSANNTSDEEEETKATGFAAFRRRFSRKRKRKSSKKNVEVVDHNKSYELRMANQKIKFTTDPVASNSKLFLLKRTFVFSPPLGPAKVNRSSRNDDNDNNNNDTSDENDATDQETRNYNLAVAALEDSSSSSSSSGFLQMLASSSSSDSSSSESSTASAGAPELATAESSDVSFLSETSSNIVAPSNDTPGSHIENSATNPQGVDNNTSANHTVILVPTTVDPLSRPSSGPSPSAEVALETSRLSDRTSPSTNESETRSLDSVPKMNSQSSTQPASDVLSPNTSSDNVLNADLDAVLDIVFSEPPHSNQDTPIPLQVGTEPNDATPNKHVGSAIDKETNVDTSTDANGDGTGEKSKSVEPNFHGVDTATNSKEEQNKVGSEKQLSSSETPEIESTSNEKFSTPPSTKSVIADVPDVDQDDNQLESSPQSNGDDALAVAQNPRMENAEAGDIANFMIHPAFPPSEETKMEITPGGEPSEETKTEITAYEDETHPTGQACEQGNIAANEDALSSGPLGMQSPGDAAVPLDPVMSPLPTEDAPAVNEAPAEALSLETPESKPLTEQPEHGGISSYCNICLLEYEVGDIVVWSRRPHGCHHAWHEDCLLDWLQRKPTCPSCRQEFFSIEDAPKYPEATQAEDNSLVEGNNTTTPESANSIATGSGRSRGRFW